MSNKDGDDNGLVWLVQCSQLMRDLAESPLEEGEHDGNSSLAERVARFWPKSSVCAEHESDWRLVAKVIHDWGVDPVPFWFYDQLVWAHNKDNAEIVDELQGLVAANAEIPPMHRFWRSLLALASADGLVKYSNTHVSTRFWLCIRAYAHSKDPRFLEYWTDHLTPPTENDIFYPGGEDFSKYVVDTRDMRALGAVLQEVERRKKDTDSNVCAMFEAVFAVDWVDAWDEIDRFFSLRKACGMWIIPVASHPAAIKWMYEYLSARNLLSFNERLEWSKNCILKMASAGRLGDFDVNDDEIPLWFCLPSTLLACLKKCVSSSIAPIALHLRQVYDATERWMTDREIEEVDASLRELCWKLVTEPMNKVHDNRRRWITLEELHRNGLMMLPEVDSDAGAAAFAELNDDVFTHIFQSNEEYPADNYDWKPYCGVQLRSRMCTLNAFGWGTDLHELRAMVDRLVLHSYGGRNGVQIDGNWYSLHISTNEFMELLDADSEVAHRAKRLRYV